MELPNVSKKDLERNRVDMLNVYLDVKEPWIKEGARLNVENAEVGELIVQRSGEILGYQRSNFSKVLGKSVGALKLWDGARNDDGTPRIEYVSMDELLNYPCYKIKNPDEVYRKLEMEMSK